MAHALLFECVISLYISASKTMWRSEKFLAHELKITGRSRRSKKATKILASAHAAAFPFAYLMEEGLHCNIAPIQTAAALLLNKALQRALGKTKLSLSSQALK